MNDKTTEHPPIVRAARSVEVAADSLRMTIGEGRQLLEKLAEFQREQLLANARHRSMLAVRERASVFWTGFIAGALFASALWGILK